VLHGLKYGDDTQRERLESVYDEAEDPGSTALRDSGRCGDRGGARNGRVFGTLITGRQSAAEFTDGIGDSELA
jgi:hypothetical protein